MELTQGMAAVVTGGASGLGKASAQALADLGLKVTIFDVNEEAGEAHAQVIGGTFARVDITDEQSVVDGFAAARAAHGQERVTVHCAMTSRRGKTLGWDKQNNCYKRLSTEDYAFGAEGILVSSYRVASLSALGMANAQPVNEDGERGCITLTASVAAQDGQMGQAAYSASKAGVLGMTLPIARDLMGEGIRINTILPGLFLTPMMRGLPENVQVALGASVPFPKRLGAPEEYAALALHMIGNSYLNGESVRLDGAIRLAPR